MLRLLGSAVVVALLVAAPALARADCTSAEKARAQQALAAFQKATPNQRSRYFKAHRDPRQRKAYAAKQAARLKALKATAACAVAPADRTAPALVSGQVDATALTLTYDEPLASAPPATSYAVTVDGLTWKVAGSSVSSTALTLTLTPGVPAGATVLVSAQTGPKDKAGNAAAALTARPMKNVTKTENADGTGSFSFRLERPPVADRQGGGYISPQLGSWAPKPEWFLPSQGEFRALMLHIDFSDAPAPRAPETYSQHWASYPSAWYREVSYGRLNYTVTDLPRWLRMSKTSSSYGITNCCPKQEMHDFMAEAVALADPFVDYTKYDAVFLIASETSAFNITLWRAFPGEGVATADGKEIRFGTWAPGYLPSSDVIQAHNIFTHESGHMLGIPDEYGRTCPTCPDSHDFAGYWTVMDQTVPGAHFFAWDKWNLGWLDTTQLRGLSAPGTLETTITPLELSGGVKAVLVPTTPTLTYVMEVRQPIGEDDDICAKGVLVYTVDSTVENGMGSVRIKSAQVGMDSSKTARCGPLYAAPFDLGAGNVAAFEDASVKLEVLVSNADGSYRVRVTKK